MRFMMVAILSVAALGCGVSATKPAPVAEPFTGKWMRCETWQGAEICEYKQLVQRGNRVCGVQRYFATNAYYEQRFVGTAKANVARIEKICGDPGSETDIYCTGRAPSDAEKVGWEASNEKLALCNGRLHGASEGDAPGCGAVSRAAGLPAAGLPKAKSLKGDGPGPEDLAWLKSCAGGAE